MADRPKVIAGPELDAEIERRVFGQSPCECGFCYIRAYSTDIAAAWLVVEKMREMGYAVNVGCCDHDGGDWEVELLPTKEWSNAYGHGVVFCDASAPFAICRAAKAALEAIPMPGRSGGV